MKPGSLRRWEYGKSEAEAAHKDGNPRAAERWPERRGPPGASEGARCPKEKALPCRQKPTPFFPLHKERIYVMVMTAARVTGALFRPFPGSWCKVRTPHFQFASTLHRSD